MERRKSVACKVNFLAHLSGYGVYQDLTKAVLKRMFICYDTGPRLTSSMRCDCKGHR